MEAPRLWRTQLERYALVGEQCPHCDAKIFPPRDVCPYCKDITKAIEISTPQGIKTIFTLKDTRDTNTT